ncbi:FMN-binding negative transcriptional regulator [Jeongeupia chitinilytica]|uniref:Transcriptional regulator n=1 Tax=Jeongeupia chitinilytica TaxID=1041641 RepID=A0ABQ3GZZ1_9NEIS|nr:FMN-binding negative transcriptional regulator [Jeongeupia chitinilytica]GHD62584.1 transcriptional regulator [Jeongeupia chitinilytica]
MYIPAHFRCDDTATIHAFVRNHGFATLISNVDGAPFASHIPLVLVPGQDGDRLIGHVARANPHWQAWQDGVPALAIFHGPHDYVSPSWYDQRPAVPTWNYAAVHASGTVRVGASLALAELIRQYEPTLIGDRNTFDPAFNTTLKAHIVGIEFTVEHWEAKFKLSQNRSEADRRHIADRLGDSELATMVRQTIGT